jgi:hypothetical protein
VKNSDHETIIHIDGFSYHTDFTGFHTPMTAHIDNQASVSFQPWRLANHLRALGLCMVVSKDGLSLNHLALSQLVLQFNQIPEPLHAIYAPLALWWASGANTLPVLVSNDYYQLGSVHAKLRAWSCAERLSALANSKQESAQGTHFDLVAYLNAMLVACVVSIENNLTLDELDSAASSALLTAITALNIRGTKASDDYLLASKTAVATTLRLCRALGWTPTQIMATPAAEIDLILALLDSGVETTTPPVSNTLPSRSLAAYPDAIVIQVEDD